MRRSATIGKCSLVTGFEADIQGSGIKGSSTQSPIIQNDGTPFPRLGSFLSSDQRLSWFGTVRGRFGVTVTPDLLLYGTGGLAYGQINNSANVHFAVAGAFDFLASVSTTKVGWTAGAGAEWMFARNWSAKVEYLYLDLGSNSVVVTNAFNPTFKVGYDWKTQENIVRAGVNYHF